MEGRKRIKKLVVFLCLAILLPITAIGVLPKAHATVAIFTISESQASGAGCAACTYGTAPQEILCTNCGAGGQGSGINYIFYDNYGDSRGQIPTNNQGNPLLQIWDFQTFTYNAPICSSPRCGDLHLYISYYVNSYVEGVCGTYLKGQYGVANNAITRLTQNRF
jgi:hypothetical protein